MAPNSKIKAYIIFLSNRQSQLPVIQQMLAAQQHDVRHDSLAIAPDPTEEHRIQEQVLTPGIEWTDVLVVLISHQTKDHPLLAWAVNYAVSLGKRVIGIWDEDDKLGTALPTCLDDLGNAVVPPDADLVTQAVESKIDGIIYPDGKRSDDRNIERHNC